MLNLLKSDLKRFFKDKLFIISLIVVAAFGILSPLLYKLIYEMATSMEIMDLSGQFTSSNLSLSGLSLSSDVGFIIPIFLAILLSREFSYGTIRNKVVGGHKKYQIYLSSLLTSIIFVLAVELVYFLINFGISSCFFKFAVGEVTSKVIGVFIGSIFLDLFIYVTVVSVLQMLVYSFKKVAIPLAIYFAVVFLSSILVVGVFAPDESKLAYKIVYFLMKIFPSIQVSTIAGFGESTTFKEVWPILLSNTIYIGGFTGLGIMIFNKSDLK